MSIKVATIMYQKAKVIKAKTYLKLLNVKSKENYNYSGFKLYKVVLLFLTKKAEDI